MALTKVVNGKRVTLSADEEKAVRAEWKANEQAMKAEREREAKQKRLRELREKLLDTRALGDTPDQAEVSEFKALKQELG